MNLTARCPRVTCDFEWAVDKPGYYFCPMCMRMTMVRRDRQAGARPSKFTGKPRGKGQQRKGKGGRIDPRPV